MIVQAADLIPIDVTVKASRDLYRWPWTTSYTLNALTVSARPETPSGFTPNAAEQIKLDERRSDGKPKNGIFTVRLSAQATACDADRKLIGRSRTAPVLGYVIA